VGPVKNRVPFPPPIPAMRTLALDTSHSAGSVAASDGELVVTRPLGVAGEHARLLAAELVGVATACGWPLADAELVAVTRGPGSFTGLRVGLATAKAVAWAGGIRLVAVSGFEVVARQTARSAGWNTGSVAIAYDAGRGDVYAAVATADPTLPAGWRIGPPSLVPAAAWIAGLPHGTRVSGPATDLHATELSRGGHLLAPAEARLPNAAAVAEAALLRAAAGWFDDPHALVPEYLRPSYADEGRQTDRLRRPPAGRP
jgi:tRNA threonylcarbamoyladenosine biosynthesis protein TsaB